MITPLILPVERLCELRALFVATEEVVVVGLGPVHLRLVAGKVIESLHPPTFWPQAVERRRQALLLPFTGRVAGLVAVVV